MIWTIVVCFASEPWHGLWQRHQHLMSRIGREGHKVVYVDPTNLLEVLGHPTMLLKRIEEVENGIIVVRPLFLPLHHRIAVLDRFDAFVTSALIKVALRMLGASRPEVVILSSPFHSFLKDRFKGSSLVYDCVDASEGLCPTEKTKCWYLSREEEIMERADAVFAVSKGLLERCVRLNPNSHLISNGVTYSPTVDELPPDLATLERPIIGFVGRLGRWVDLALIHSLAMGRPDCSIALIGPIDTKDDAVHALRRSSNVHFLGTKEFRTIASYIEGMDVCIIPFKVEPLTAMANPVKFFEYASLGKPIVSTPLDGVLEFSDLIYASDGSSDDFVAKVGVALREQDPELQERRRAVAREYDWGAITHHVEGILMDLCAAKKERPAPER